MAAGADAKHIKALEGHVNRLERELSAVRTELRSTVQGVRSFAEKARTDLTALQAIVQTHTIQLGQAQTALQSHANRLTSLEARVTALGG